MTSTQLTAAPVSTLSVFQSFTVFFLFASPLLSALVPHSLTFLVPASPCSPLLRQSASTSRDAEYAQGKLDQPCHISIQITPSTHINACRPCSLWPNGAPVIFGLPCLFFLLFSTITGPRPKKTPKDQDPYKRRRLRIDDAIFYPLSIPARPQGPVSHLHRGCSPRLSLSLSLSLSAFPNCVQQTRRLGVSHKNTTYLVQRRALSSFIIFLFVFCQARPPRWRERGGEAREEGASDQA
jgi:hypothetical protein